MLTGKALKIYYFCKREENICEPASSFIPVQHCRVLSCFSFIAKQAEG